MKAIVTGGAGFIGSNLALTLEMKGAKVLVIDDFSCGNFENLKTFKGDVIAKNVNKFDWNQAASYDVIFHQAALTDTTVSDQKKMMFNNVEGFRKIIEFSIKKQIRLVYASSAAVYGNEPAPQRETGNLNPLNVYGYSKWLGDQMALKLFKSAKAPIVGLRYFNVFGLREAHKKNYASMIYQLSHQMISGKRPRIFRDGEQSRDHIYVKDVVEANLKAAQSKKSGIVNVATGKPTTFNRLIEILNDVLETQLKPDYFDNPYSFYQNKTQADMNAVKKLIGFEAKYSIEKGVREYVTDFYQLKPKKSALAVSS